MSERIARSSLTLEREFAAVCVVAIASVVVLHLAIKPEPSSNPAPPIFIADDESDDLFLIEHRLRKAGVKHPLVIFRDGEELVAVLEKIAAHESPQPCLLLLDLHMPLIDGFDVIAWLRARPEFKTLPVAVITSSTRAVDRERVTEAGVKEFLEKFPSEGELARVVAWASNHPFGEGDNAKSATPST